MKTKWLTILIAALVFLTGVGNRRVGVVAASAPLGMLSTLAPAVEYGDTIIAVSAAPCQGDGGHNLALMRSGKVYEWGDANSCGSQGGSGFLYAPTLVRMGTRGLPIADPVVAVSAGADHDLAVTKAGRVYAWGGNRDGQLGTGSMQSFVPNPTAVPLGAHGLPPDDPVQSIAAGDAFSLALTRTGKVYVWGRQVHANPVDPVKHTSLPLLMRLEAQGLSTDDPVTTIAAGASFSLALTRHGDVYMWVSAHVTATRVDIGALGADRVAAITVGLGSAIVLTHAGAIYDLNTQVPADYSRASGSGISQVSLSAPVQGFPRLDPVAAISSGYSNIALTRGGRVYTWGAHQPLVMEALGVHGLPLHDPAVAVAAGNGYYLVLVRSGRMYGWGLNAYGTIGDTSTIGRAYPVLVAFGRLQSTGFDPATDVSAAGDYSVALLRSGYVAAWGTNTHGQLGNGSTSPSTIPVRAKFNYRYTAVRAGSEHVLALSSYVSPYVDVWGSNQFGQLGIGGGKDQVIPTQTYLETCGSCEDRSVTSAAAGDRHSLALLNTGDLYAWGSNASGQLGVAGRAQRAIPVLANVFGSPWPEMMIAAVAAGAAHSLALTDDGKVFAWGSNSAGQLGNGQTKNTSVPVLVKGLPSREPIVAIAAAGNLSIALTNSGKVYTWGSNQHGQLGNGSDAPYSSHAVRVQTSTTGLPAGDPVVIIAAGPDHALAVTQRGQVFSWGSNQFGQLGNGGTSDSSVPVAALTGNRGFTSGDLVTSIAAGAKHSLAVTSSGALYAWGANNAGQLGIGSTLASPVPVQVGAPVAGR